MAIHVNMKPEAQQELRRQAAACGMHPEEYATTLLEKAIHAGERKELSVDDLDHALRDLAQFSAKIPLLAPAALTRSGLYQDHD